MPQRIILGGGVMNHGGLIDAVRSQVQKTLNDYIDLPENYIVKPELGDLSGVTGALLLASQKKYS